ncbi:MAG: hypothetical protein IJS45_01895 [Clostridia bacterium]|nr:hypothetical protein [Clostridia bacterium]
MSDKLSIIVENIKLPSDSTDEDAIDRGISRLNASGLFGKVIDAGLYKRSVDARHKNDIKFVCSVLAVVETNRRPSDDKLAKFGFKVKSDDGVSFTPGTDTLSARPVIVGFGPAGMFASLYLAKHGYSPLVIERGDDVERRAAAVERFKQSGILDTDSNVQFGAGGAGTFSDGKLMTRIGDPLVHSVLSHLVEMGAPDTVLKTARPHIGTDVLRRVVANFHKEIESLGGEIRYRSALTSIGDGYIEVNGEKLPCGALILAIGHSARDTYRYLYDSGYSMTVKPFSVGVRIEHLTADIDRAMYGDESLCEKLGHAEYNLSMRRGERGVYTFCMCPGGEVVSAASEEGGVVTNGMSNHARDGMNSNSAVAVSVLPSDVGGDPMSAVSFQRSLERRAFEAAGSDYFAPCQTVKGFLEGRADAPFGDIIPTYRGGKVRAADLNSVLPPFVTSMLKEGIVDFGKKIRGFDSAFAPLTGVESRTSSPVRILRGDDYSALGYKNVYPCGEGAGYAGGIVSAAVDGIRVAGAVISRFKPLE